MVLFADDISIIITDTNRRDFNINANQTFQDINTWFKVNLLTLNHNKTQYWELRTKNYYDVNTQIKYDHECIISASEIKFLGLTIVDTLSWQQHIEQVLNKICTAGYALRNIKHIVPIDTLRVIYFAHIHSIISYGMVFWDSFSYANKVFILQKKIIRIITNTRPGDSCREVFKSLEIMTLYSQYIYSLVLYTIINTYLMQITKFINIKLGITIICTVQYLTYQNSIKELIYQFLTSFLNMTNDHKYFKSTLKRFIYHHSFYSMNEYYEYKEDRRI